MGTGKPVVSWLAIRANYGARITRPAFLVAQSTLKIPFEVGGRLQSYRYAQHSLTDAGLIAGGLRQPPVGGTGWMCDGGLDIPQVSRDRDEPSRIDHAPG